MEIIHIMSSAYHYKSYYNSNSLGDTFSKQKNHLNNMRTHS